MAALFAFATLLKNAILLDKMPIVINEKSIAIILDIYFFCLKFANGNFLFHFIQGKCTITCTITKLLLTSRLTLTQKLLCYT